jgi:hypothetical protein
VSHPPNRRAGCAHSRIFGHYVITISIGTKSLVTDRFTCVGFALARLRHPGYALKALMDGCRQDEARRSSGTQLPISFFG